MKDKATLRRSFHPGCAGSLALTLAIAAPGSAFAAFHFAVIDELMTSYDGDASVQFVEIRMLSGGQNIVGGSKLAAFGADGSLTSVVLTVPSNVSSGADRRWIMATSALETISGLTADFTFPGGLPTESGMVCWGKPFDEGSPNSYVDCVSFGDYSGPPNNHTAAPSAFSPDGHSLRRVGDSASSAIDFACADSADPTNNAGESAELVSTLPCFPDSTTTTTTTTTSTTSTTMAPVVCGDGTGDAMVTATDALLALATAVGAQSCALCLCDVDSSGQVTSTDALRLLTASVGGQVELVCVPC